MVLSIAPKFVGVRVGTNSGENGRSPVTASWGDRVTLHRQKHYPVLLTTAQANDGFRHCVYPLITLQSQYVHLNQPTQWRNRRLRVASFAALLDDLGCKRFDLKCQSSHAEPPAVFVRVPPQAKQYR